MTDDKYSKLQKTAARQRNEIARLTMQCEELAAVLSLLGRARQVKR